MTTEAKQTLATRLKELRDWAGLSQKAVGTGAGVTAGAVGMIETGKRESPEAETLYKLAAYFGTSVEWLLHGFGVAPTKETVIAKLAAPASEPGPTEPGGAPEPTFPVSASTPAPGHS